MHEQLVRGRRWIDESRFLRALNCCMPLPGFEARQLRIYIGWLLHGTLCGFCAGTLFALPSAVILWGLSWTYVLLGELPWVTAFFLGPELFRRRCRGLADARCACPSGGESQGISSPLLSATPGARLDLSVLLAAHVVLPTTRAYDWFSLGLIITVFVGLIRWKWNIVDIIIGGGGEGLA
jgi:hypothetical protein